MAKGDKQRSNREQKKPKKVKEKAAAPSGLTKGVAALKSGVKKG